MLVVVLALRLHRTGPHWVARRLGMATSALVVAVAAKTYLIGWLNPTARDSTVSAAVVRAESIHWAVINGVAIVAVATALILLTSWRTGAAETSRPVDGPPPDRRSRSR